RHPPAEERVGAEIRVVEALDHGLADDPLELAEVNHHPRLRIDRPPDRDIERVGVAVDPREPAEDPLVLRRRPVVDPVAVGRGEGEAPGAVGHVGAHGRTSRKRGAPRPSRRWSARRRTDSGPSPTMRTWTRGIRARRSTAAWSRSASRLRGYIRATESTVGRVAGRRSARAKRRRHSPRSIGSGTTASFSGGMPYASPATDAE